MAATVEYEIPLAHQLLYELVIMARVDPMLFLIASAHLIKDILLDSLHDSHCPNCKVSA